MVSDPIVTPPDFTEKVITQNVTCEQVIKTGALPYFIVTWNEGSKRFVVDEKRNIADVKAEAVNFALKMRDQVVESRQLIDIDNFKG